MIEQTISENGIDLIEHFEGIHDGDLSTIGLEPKMDPSGIWTEGFGHAMRDEKGNYLKGAKNKDKAYSLRKVTNITQARRLLEKDLIYPQRAVNSLDLNLTQGQFDALVSFAYNCGVGALNGSTLVTEIRNGVRKKEEIERYFLMWNKSGGRVLPGLVARRKCEARLYNDGVLKF